MPSTCFGHRNFFFFPLSPSQRSLRRVATTFDKNEQVWRITSDVYHPFVFSISRYAKQRCYPQCFPAAGKRTRGKTSRWSPRGPPWNRLLTFIAALGRLTVLESHGLRARSLVYETEVFLCSTVETHTQYTPSGRSTYACYLRKLIEMSALSLTWP